MLLRKITYSSQIISKKSHSEVDVVLFVRSNDASTANKPNHCLSDDVKE